MRDYSNLGLNDRLQSLSSPILKAGTIEEPFFVQASSLANPPGRITSYSGTGIIDRTGLVSEANFKAERSAAITDNAFTSSTATPAIDGTISYNLPRSSQVLFIFTGRGNVGSAGDILAVQIVDSQSSIGTMGPDLRFDTTTLQTHTQATIRSLAAGTHDTRIEGRKVIGTSAGTIEQGDFSIIPLGN